MRTEDIVQWLTQQPFVPFRIVLSNGRAFDVRDPNTVSFFSRGTLLIGELDPDFPIPVFSKSTSASLIHINHIEPITEPAPAAAG